MFTCPSPWLCFSGEGKIGIGKKYIVAAIVVVLIIVILSVGGVFCYRKFGQDFKQKVKGGRSGGGRNSGARGRAREEEPESVPLPPYNDTGDSSFSWRCLFLA